MSRPHTSQRLRASEHPQHTKHWGSVWIAADRRAPFKVEQSQERPRRPWWQR